MQKKDTNFADFIDKRMKVNRGCKMNKLTN